MAYLLDTSILLRSSQPGTSPYAEATRAIRVLIAWGEDLYLVPQCLYEFWVVATRPVGDNGLGWDTATTAAEIARLQTLFPLLLDDPALFAEWHTLVTGYGIQGKQAHDARLVAAMNLHGIDHILSFNDRHFTRFTHITAVNPANAGITP